MLIRLSPDCALPNTTQPILLMLPGAGCSPAIYAEVQLKGWVAIAVDWASGHLPLDPLSIAQRICALLQNHRGTVALAGHSMGAATAVLSAALAPQSVNALIVSNTGVHSRNHGDPTLVARVRRQWGPAEQQAFLSACFVRPPPPPIWSELCDYLKALPVERFLASVEGLRAMDLTTYLAQVEAPTLIAHGRDDTRRTIGDAEQLAAGIPRAQLKLLSGGHTPMVDCAQDYNNVVAQFLDSIPTQRDS